MDFPEGAKKMFSGVRFDVYQYPQKMFDGSEATFEFVVRVPSADVIAVVDDKLMLLSQQQPDRMEPYPSLPGGTLEKGEDPLEAAKRELLEETGYACESIELFQEYFGYTKMRFHESIYLAKGCKKIADQQVDGGEKITVRLVDLDEFLQQTRNIRFAVPIPFKYFLYECLVDEKKKEDFRKKLFG